MHLSPDLAHEPARLEPADLRHKAAVGFAWTAGGLAVAEPLRILTTAVLARILTPRDFGVVTMAAVFIGLVAFANDFGLTVALIQRRDLTERVTSSVFWVSMAVGLTLTLASWLAAPWIANVYREQAVVGVVRGLSLSFTLTSLFLVQGALLRRQMDFRTPAMASIWAMVAHATVSISLAASGFGPMSIVAGNLAALTASGAFVQWKTRYVPRTRPRWSEARAVVAFGAAVTAGDLASYGGGNVDNLVVGRQLGPSALGAYGVAYNLVTYPVRRIAKMAAAVTLPAFSSIGEDGARFRSAYVRTVSLAAVVLWPLLACALVVADDLVIGLYGSQWTAAIAPFRVLCVAAMALVATVFGELALKSLGKPRAYAFFASFSFVAIALAVLATVAEGAVAVAAGVTLAGTLTATAIQVYVARLLRVTAGNLGEMFAAPLLVTVVAAAACMGLVSGLSAIGLQGILAALTSIGVSLGAVWLVGRRVRWMSIRSAEELALSVFRRNRTGSSHPQESGSHYTDSHTAPDKGAQYEEYYRTDRWNAWLWEREQAVLGRVVTTRCGPRCADALDFACGTGRVSSFIAPMVRTLVGVDVSEPMLAEARHKLSEVEFVLGDIVADPDILGERRFDLVTAFRFFVNAEPALREAAMQRLASLMRSDGLLVFNVHHHNGSPYVKLVKWHERRRGRVYNSMSLGEIRALVEKAGLRVAEIHGVGLFHVPKVKLPDAVNSALESLLGHLPGNHIWAEDLIVVAERADG